MIQLILAARVALLICFLPLAVSAISEADYQNEFAQKVRPFFAASESHQFKSFDDAVIHYRHFKRGHDKVILIIPGRTEPTSKYAELVYDLKDTPYDFILLDPRGQGYSERLVKDDPKKGYVKNYSDYVRDLKKLKEIALAGYQEVIFLGHSMGGAIGMLYEETYPQSFTKMILSCPMMQMKTQNLSEAAALASLQLLEWIGRGKSYIPGGGPDQVSGPFEENRVTSSRARFQMAREIDQREPALIMASATVGWTVEALKMGRRIFKERASIEFPPVLMFQAEHDEFSFDERQQEFCQERKSCELIFMKDSKHEMLQERDEIRTQVIKHIKDFL